MENRLILGLDNSMDFLNIVVSREDRIIEERHIRPTRHPSEILPLAVKELLSDHRYTISDLNLIMITLGPGSFTGIRVALAFCKGIRAGTGLPLLGIPTLDTLTYPFTHMERHYLCPMIDAKKGEVFHALYHVNEGYAERITDYRSTKPERVADIIQLPCLCFGTGARICAGKIGDTDEVQTIFDRFDRISGEAVIRTGLLLEKKEHPLPAEPIYGRRSEAEIKFDVNVV